jgi:hypothetical protein
MRIAITYTVEINTEAWASTFKIDKAPNIVRADVRRYLRVMARDHLAERGLAASPGE